MGRYNRYGDDPVLHDKLLHKDLSNKGFIRQDQLLSPSVSVGRAA